MEWLAAIGLVTLMCFSLVQLVGAPYLPTLKPQVQAALKLINLKPGQVLIELGCGDGKVMIAAAQAGITVIGYELNPFLVLLSRWRCRRFKNQVTVIWGNFWRRDWPPADGIFTFLLPKYMAKLDKRITQYASKPVKLVTFAFTIPGRLKSAENNNIFLYLYN